MASQGMPMPGAMQGEPAGAPQSSPAGSEANPLQVALGRLIQVIGQLAEQNPIVNAELNEMRRAGVKALQKTMLASRPQPQPEGQPSPAPQAG